jgi:hypothetical protein
MDRILGVNTIDLGGGRRGFRGKDTVAGIPGTELAATWHNGVQEELVRLIELCGGNPSNTDFTQVAKAIQSGALNFAIATGTANAWVIDLPLAPLAYVAGLPFEFIAPATNTSTTVNANAEGLGNKRIKKRDGSDPAVGDLVVGTLYRGFYDGASIRVLTPLPSDTLATVAATVPISHNATWSQGLVDSVQTDLTSYTTVDSNLDDASFSGGILTVGARTAGLWLIVLAGAHPLANAEFLVQIQNDGTGGTAVAYNSSRTSTGAPFVTATGILRRANGQKIRGQARQISGGGTSTCSGRLSLIRLGA